LSNKLRIVVLAHGLASAGGLSVGFNIVKSLLAYSQKIDFFFIVPGGAGYEKLQIEEFSKVYSYEKKFGPLSRFFFDKVTLPRMLNEFSPDWILGLGNMSVPSVDCDQAILFHKSQLLYPKKHSVHEVLLKKFKNYLIKRQIEKGLEKTKIVFCQTRTARERFKNVFSYNGRMELWPNAISVTLKDFDVNKMVTPQNLSACDGKLKLFILTRYYPHKNLEKVVDCFSVFREELKDVVCILTIEASQHPKARTLLDDIKEKNLDNVFINVGPLKQEELHHYYYYSDALLLPTLLESFSGTYLESMSYHRPIITSDLDFAKEVCGDAALYFDPWSIESLKEAIMTFKASQAIRDKLVDLGDKELEKYNLSWDETTKRALDVVNEETV
jgi:glycosyltransferase involved in cell wall biosynthesis